MADYEDIERALSAFDTLAVREVVRRAVSFNPDDRFHLRSPCFWRNSNAFKTKRKEDLGTKDRRICVFCPTKMAMERVSQELDIESERQVRHFIAEDINEDAAVQRFIENIGQMNERIRPDHFSVIGGTFRYHAAKDERQLHSFALINVSRPDPHALQRDRAISAFSPLTFAIDSRTGAINADEAVCVLEQRIDAFEAAQKEDDLKQAETAAFDHLATSAGRDSILKKIRLSPIQFSAAAVDGTFLTLSIDEEPEGASVNAELFTFGWRVDPWRNMGHSRWRGCSKLSRGTPFTNCPQWQNQTRPICFAGRGRAAARMRLSSQIRHLCCNTTQSLLLEPRTVSAPQAIANLQSEFKHLLDDSKREVLRLAMGSAGMLLIARPLPELAKQS